MRKISALILAAGEGKRMKSGKAKVTHSLCGKPMVEWVIDAVRKAGIDEVVLVTGKNAEQVKQCVGDKANYVLQEEQLGTGHAVMQAEEYYKGYKGNIVVLCGDTPLIEADSIKAAVEYHLAGNYAATVITAEIEKPEGYGRVIKNADGSVKRIVEHRDASPEERAVREINAGMYVFSAEELFGALKEIGRDNDQGEYYLTDAVGILSGKGYKTGAFKLEDPNQALGVNDRVQLSQSAELLRWRILKKLMLSGVTIIDPKAAYIDEGVQIGTDTVVYPGTILEGRTVIGEACEIGPNTRIVNSRIGNGTCISYSVILESVIGDNATIGPYSYIRPDCNIGSNVKIGDFVELKNTSVGEMTKIPHLAYVGDSEVGENTNIACGVITVNYDGKKKNKTQIGSNAFVGCNVNLVAPVKVGDNTYIAAGSTITEEVPEYALAVARSRQTIKNGWVIKKGMKNNMTNK